MGLGALKATLARPAEAFGRPPVGLHFRHFRRLRNTSLATYELKLAAAGGF